MLSRRRVSASHSLLEAHRGGDLRELLPLPAPPPKFTDSGDGIGEAPSMVVDTEFERAKSGAGSVGGCARRGEGTTPPSSSDSHSPSLLSELVLEEELDDDEAVSGARGMGSIGTSFGDGKRSCRR